MPSLTEDLCHKAKAGDSSAYEQLFALHSDRAKLFIQARLGPKLRSTIDGDDVLQDAFLAAHRSFADFSYANDGSFFRWLCRIIENRIRDWHDYAGAAKRQPVPLPVSDPTGPVTALDRKLQRQRLLAALQQLNEDHRAVLLMRYFEGVSAAEAATRLARTDGAVRKLTARALAELAKQLNGKTSKRQG